MAKKSTPLGYKTMPEPVQRRNGMKVGWYYYNTKEEAEAAAVIARHNGEIDRGLGYDFGYQSPGSITLCTDTYWPSYKGLWEVCVS